MSARALAIAVAVTGLCVGCNRPAPSAADSPSAAPVAVSTAGDAMANQYVAPPCLIDAANPGGTLSINGAVVADLALDTLRPILGEPDRTERIESRQRYERKGYAGGQPHSEQVTVVDYHYVYDQLGLVLRTRNRRYDDRRTPVLLLVFFANPRTFDHTAAPAVVPAQRGGCVLAINGTPVDPARDLRPPGVADVDTVPLLGTTWAMTSSLTVIDRLYTPHDARNVHVFLDGPQTGRPSYAEVR